MSKRNKVVICNILAFLAAGRKAQHSKTPTAFLPLGIANISHFPCDLRLEFERRQKKKPDFKRSLSISIISDLWPYVLEVFNDFRIQRCTSISVAPEIQIPGYIIVGYILNLTGRSAKHPTCRHT